MKEPQFNPQVAELALPGQRLLCMTKSTIVLAVFDADQQGADWREVCRIVLRIDPDTEADRARLALESHLACQMDDRARISPSAAKRRRLIIATPASHA
jgi:hypothetical protein